MTKALITGTGIYIAPNEVSNAELVASFNTWVDNYNLEHKDEIANGALEAKKHSNVEFIEKASGIKKRFLIDKEGVLDPNRILPKLKPRSIEEPSLLAQMSLEAGLEALKNANLDASELDMIICSASNPERAYPGVAIELQELLGAEKAYSYDMHIGCSSATFAIKMAKDAINNGTAKRVLIVSPEVCSGHIDFHDRDSHFIFCDACSAIVLEAEDVTKSTDKFEILDAELITKFSNNIRNDEGFLAKCYVPALEPKRLMFVQNGNKVFKEVTLMVVDFVKRQFKKNSIEADDIARVWFHQANINMDLLIAKRIFRNREITEEFLPNILGKYGNASSAGSIIAFHENHSGLNKGDLGLICAFGAGYSIGSILIKKI